MSKIYKLAVPKDGNIIIASDGHYWPGRVPTAHLALIVAIERMKPKAVIFNGDVMDMPTISRHPPIGWEKHPSLAKELNTARKRLSEIEDAAPKGCKLIWPLGNHDARFNTRLAQVASQFKGIHGTRLMDHFPRWIPCWRVDIGNEVVVKHEFKGGTHAAYQNAKHAGKTIVTGHRHSQKIVPITDYRGTRYGIDAGCIADVSGPQFDYGEANPADWRSGFVMLSWIKGRMMPPQLLTVIDEKKRSFWFNGLFVEPARKV